MVRRVAFRSGLARPGRGAPCAGSLLRHRQGSAVGDHGSRSRCRVEDREPCRVRARPAGRCRRACALPARRSAMSASRIASMNCPWNSDARRRILPTNCPTWRSTRGRSFGRDEDERDDADDDQLARVEVEHAPSALHPLALHPSDRGRAEPAGDPSTDLVGLCLAAGDRLRRREHRWWSGPVGNDQGCGASAPPGAADGFVLVVRLHQALLEALEPLGDVAHDVGNLVLAAEQQEQPAAPRMIQWMRDMLPMAALRRPIDLVWCDLFVRRAENKADAWGTPGARAIGRPASRWRPSSR